MKRKVLLFYLGVKTIDITKIRQREKHKRSDGKIDKKPTKTAKKQDKKPLIRQKL